MKTCSKCSANFEVTPEDKNFYEKISPTFNGQKFSVPEPTLCPHCRMQQRLSWRNATEIYKRTCDLCKKSIISEYSPDKPLTVYCQKCYWSDQWSPLDYGKEFDFSRTFNEQFKDLIEKVPLLAVINVNTQNSEYCHRIFNGKDNYYSFVALYDPEGLSNTYFTFGCKHSIDLTRCTDVEWSYELVDCQKCYECFYSRRLNNCKNCYFSEDLIGCTNCFGCKNLINKSYCVFNKQYSEEEYAEFIKNAKLDQYSNVEKYKQESARFFSTLPNKNVIVVNCENCSGAYLRDCKNCRECYDIYEAKDLAYCESGEKSEDCQNCYGFGMTEHSSNSTTTQEVNNIHFCATLVECNNLWYCYACYSNTSFSFGSASLKHNKYCILNKQYSPEEYEKLVAKIIDRMEKTGEWGQFLGSKASPFGYMETVAKEYFPLPKEKTLAQGFNWSDYEAPLPNVEKVILADELPEDTESVTEKIVDWAIKCEDSSKLFRLTVKELDFYHKYKIPIPRKHPNVRHTNRLNQRLSIRLWERKCAKCNKEITASYPSDYQGIVYCEECYNQEVY